MSNAHRDPHVLVSAKIGGSQKLLNLPSHRARWGWIVMLGQAKLQRPPGRFASLAQARFLAGEFRDCVPAWLEVGLLHAAPVARECKSSGCGPAALGEITDAEMIVHDWRAHQERSRTTEWRDANGVPNGHSNLSGETPGKQPGNTGETPSPRVPTRDRAEALQSQSLSQSENAEGVQGEPNAWDAFAVRTGEIPGEKMRTWLDELSEAHSEGRVVAMLGRLSKTQRTSVDYLKAVRDALRAEDFEAEKAERAAEKAAVARKRAPLRAVPAQDISEAEAKRLAAEYLAASKGGAA